MVQVGTLLFENEKEPVPDPSSQSVTVVNRVTVTLAGIKVCYFDIDGWKDTDSAITEAQERFAIALGEAVRPHL